MARKKSKKSVKGMWLIWLAIFFILAAAVQKFLWIFFDGDALLWSAAGCAVIGILLLAYIGSKAKHRKTPSYKTADSPRSTQSPSDKK